MSNGPWASADASKPWTLAGASKPWTLAGASSPVMREEAKDFEDVRCAVHFLQLRFKKAVVEDDALITQI